MTDVNDNAPKFELPDYQAHNVDEDIPLGTSILKVKAMDADSGKNAEIEYLVSGDYNLWFFYSLSPTYTSDRSRILFLGVATDCVDLLMTYTIRLLGKGTAQTSQPISIQCQSLTVLFVTKQIHTPCFLSVFSESDYCVTILGSTSQGAYGYTSRRQTHYKDDNFVELNI